MIKVSDIAKEKAIQLMKDDGFNPETDYIRVGVKSGGCSGLEYVLKFDKEKTDIDQVFEDNGIKIIVDKPVDLKEMSREEKKDVHNIVNKIIKDKEV